MNYNKTIWEDNKSEINAAKLNNIETGIEYAVNSVENINVQLDKRVKFKVVGEEDTEVPPIHGGNSYDDTELIKRIDNIDKQINTINSEFKKRYYFPQFKGINLYVMNYTSNETIKSYLDDIAKNGCNAVFITAHNEYTNGVFTPNLTDEQVVYSITEAKKRRIKPILKLHRMGKYEADNELSWITEWGKIVDKYVAISKVHDIDTIVFCNEQDKFTKTNKEAWKAIIDRIKTNGLKVAISYRGINEYYSSVLNDLVDIIGINHYPKMTIKGHDISDTNMLKKFYAFYNVVNSIKHKYNKECWITEIGCTRNIDALSDPSNWEFDTTEQSYTPQILYYKNLLKAYGESEQIGLNGIFFWSTDKKDKINSYSPFGNKECEQIIASYEVNNLE